MIHPRFAAALGLGILLWVSLFLGFTLLVDPYGVSPLHVSVAGFNKYKPRRVDIDRLLKPYEVWRYQPKTVFLGTSRTHQSMDPAVLDGTRFAPAYNASIPASSLGLNISHLQQYLKLDPNLRTVVIELFIYNFLGQGQEHPPKDFYEYLRNCLNLFVSADTFWAAIQTVGYNLTSSRPAYEIKPGGYFYYPPGHNAKGPFGGFPAGIWQLHATRLKGMQLYEPAFEAVHTLIELCRQRNIELIFVLTPNHAYDDYYVDAIGGWGAVQEWLARLVAENATIYSFSQPNAWVDEPVTEHMRYWNDPYHFTLKMGRGILQTLAGIPVPGLPGNFAVRLTRENAAALVDARRVAVREWAKSNPDFVAAFWDERSRWESRQAAGSDSVAAAMSALEALEKQVAQRFPAASIVKYRVVTGDVAGGEGIPEYLVKGARKYNPWGGRLVAQIFPANAWGSGLPAMYNYYFEAVPRKDCARLVEALGRDVRHRIFRINLEPSGKVHSRFPVTGADGCIEGKNSVGYTVVAD